jgi:cytochrome c553
VSRESNGAPGLTRGLALAVLVAAGVLPAAAQDIEAGKKVAGMCRTCHGLDGLAQIPLAPNIGGERADYLAGELGKFRSGERQHEMMNVVAASLSDQQIADVAAWYAAHTATAEMTADPSGAPELCSGCHGVDGIAVIPEAPNLAGENNIYIETQVKAFRSGKRVGNTMSGVAADLTDEEIRAAADWYGTVRLTLAPPG